MPMGKVEFLAFVDANPGEKWELIDGRPVAMGGAIVRHALVAANIAEALAQPARAKGCRVLRDLFFQVAANDGQIFDPDVMIRCGPMGDLQERTINDAGAVFEVLSPSTMNYDRGVKATAYMQTPSVGLVALVYPGEWRVEAWARDARGAWPDGPEVLKSRESVLAVALIDAHLPLAAIYDGVQGVG